MKIDITARNFTLTEKLKVFSFEKINKLSKYDKDIISACIVLLKESRAEKVELFVSSKNNKYISKCYTSVFEKTIIKAVKNIVSQIKKNKENFN